MRRRRRRGSDDAITLFPFLAVLICTVGSLIVLLVVVVEQAKANAASVSKQRESERASLEEQNKLLRERTDEFSWRMEILESSRQQTAEQLEDRRRELSHLENEIRNLSQELDAAVEEARRIAAEESDEVAQQAANEKQVEDLRSRLANAERDLEVARETLSKRKPSYSIVAYDGPHSTERRPIFIECTGERVILQPEGIELYGIDFKPPITDDNALAAALRAKREYLARTFRDQDDQPYPLIVVRPDGAQAYAAARAAMKSWDAEFGYELVDQNLELKFPKRDAAMVAIVMDAIEEARFQRQRLRAIAPARFGRRKGGTLTASRNGGFVRNGGTDGGSALRSRQHDGQPGGLGSTSGPNSNRGGSSSPHGNRLGTAVANQSGPRGNPLGGNRGNLGQNGSYGPSGNNGRGFLDQAATGSGALGGNPSSSNREHGSLGNRASLGNRTNAGGFGGNGQGGGNGPGQGNGLGDGNQERSPYEPIPEDLQQNDLAEVGSASGGEYQGNTAIGAEFGQGNTSLETNSSAPSSGGQANSNLGTAESQANSNSGGSSATNPGGSNPGGSGGSGGSSGARAPAFPSPGQPASGMGSMSVGSSAMSQPPLPPMANARGADWGLPNGSRGSVGITRPIPVLLTGEYLEFKPEERQGRPERVNLKGSMQNEIDQLVSTLWRRMDKWGIAGASMHWKPVLTVRVHPSGEQRFQELSQLLKDSGIAIKRKN
ncbi:MAG: hypothetical protein GY768_03040 [Planctomycetaceae bacterium]|nr:hypothetical protein [Planctomycetaceae bacterium]